MNGPRFKNILERFDLQTDLWWLAIMATGLLGSVLAAFAFHHSGAFWVHLTLAIRLSIVIYIARQEWGEVFRKLLTLGLVFGVFSIFPDYMLVHGFIKGKLIYPPEASTLLLASPAYAMLGWTVRIVEFGYLVTRVYAILMKRWSGETGLGLAMVVGGVSSAILLGSREFLGAHAGWWSYGSAHVLIGSTSPVYTIAAAALFFGIFLNRFSHYVEEDAPGLHVQIRHGAILAAILFASYLFCYVLVEHSFR